MTTERIETILEFSEGPMVLDLGAVQHDAENATNEDWLHFHLTQAHERVIGVDILAEDIERLNNIGYEMVQANVEVMELGVEADCIVAGELIEHVSNAGRMLDRVKEHLKPEGRFILSTPNPWAGVHLRRLLHGDIQINEEHTTWYGPVVLRQLLARHGFDVIELRGTGPVHRGFTRLAQWFRLHPFGYTTWVVVAEHA